MIDPWAQANPESYLESVQFFLLIVLIVAVIFQGASGRLKSRPDKREVPGGVARDPATPVLMVGYLFLLSISAVIAVFFDVRLHDYVASPLIHYFVFVPFALIYVIQRYRFDRRERT